MNHPFVSKIWMAAESVSDWPIITEPGSHWLAASPGHVIYFVNFYRCKHELQNTFKKIGSDFTIVEILNGNLKIRKST